jgi:thiol:disulfide interchange protein
MKGVVKKYLFPTIVLAVAVAAIASWSVPERARKNSGEEIHWMTDLTAAQAKSRESGKPMMVDFFATWCPPCKMLDANTYSDARVIEASRKWVMVRIDVDQNKRLAMEHQIATIPTIIVALPNGTQFTRESGYMPPSDMLKLMERAMRQVPPPADLPPVTEDAKPQAISGS